MKAMKKTVGILSLVIMLLSQIFTPLTYAATGDNEDNPVIPEVLEEQEADIDEPENPVGIGDLSSGNNTGVDAVSRDVVIIPEIQANAEYSGDAENYSGSTEILSGDLNVFSGNTNNLSGTDENLKEIEEISNGSGKEEKTGFIENVKSFFGIGEDEEESKEIYGSSEYEGVKVEVYAATGLFASGTELTIQPVTGPMIEDVKEVLSGEVNMVEEEQKQTVVAFDITFRDPVTKEELQPKNGTVQVIFNYEDNTTLKQAEENEEQEVKVYHLNDIDEKGDKIENITETIVEEAIINEEDSKEKGIMVVEADSFSVYTIVVQVIEEQLINFEYGEISIEDPEHPGTGITIMDRNLGAKVAGTGDSSYGYYYQWGNNYGFPTMGNVATSSDLVNVSDLNSYSGSTFRLGYSWMSEPNNFVLWIGDNKQGPCPEGWHIPTIQEWNQLVDYYIKANYTGVELNTSTNGNKYTDDGIIAKGFFNKFYIPRAGYRRHDTSIREDINYVGYYRSSSNTPGSANKLFFRINDNSIYMHNSLYTTYGYSVRCFKDNYSGTGKTFKITYEYNGGFGSAPAITVISGGKAEKPTNPMRDNSIFSGWYLKGSTTEFDFNTPIDSDITLYAKRECEEGYISKGNNCVKDVNGLEATLITGVDFNKTIKGLAIQGTVNDKNVKDNMIVRIRRANSIPSGVTSTRISTDDSTEVKAWYNKGTLYYYSEAGTIYFNENSADMFLNLEGLTNIDLANFDTSNVRDMTSMFYGCSSLKELDLTSFNTSSVTNMSAMFYGCSSLKNLDLSNFNTENVQSFGAIFNGASSLETLNLNRWDLRSTSGLGGAFGGTTSLKYISMSGWKIPTSFTHGLGRNWNAGSSPLEEIDVTNWDLSSTTDLQGLFAGSKIKKIKGLETWNTSNVRNMSAMFQGCSSLTELDLSSFDTSIVTNMSLMFYGCSSLTELNLSNFNTENVTKLSNMFEGASSLETLNLNRWNLRKATDMGSMFASTSSLKYISMSGWKIPTSFTHGLGRSWSAGLSPLEEIDVTNWDLSITTDLQGLFAGSKIKKIKGLETWDTSIVTNMSSMFQGCSSLTELDLSSFDTSIVTNMSSMFQGCSSLTELDLSSFDTSIVTNMSSMFDGCSSLTELDLSSFDTSMVSNMGTMFLSDSDLMTIYVSDKFNTSNVSSSSAMFYGDTQLIGGSGTVFNESKMDKDYARIDGGEENPGYFTNILDKPYTITYELNNGTGENRTGYTSRDDTFTLNNPTREGYTFLGWTGSNLTEPTVDVEIVKGTKGNLHFTANWKLIENTVISTPSSSGKGRVLPSKQKATTEEQEHNAADEKAVTETESNNESENNQEDGSLSQSEDNSAIYTPSQSVTVKQQVRKIASKTLTRGEVAVMTNVLIDVFPQLLTDKQEIKDNNECISFADEASFTSAEKSAATRLCKLGIMGIHGDTKEQLDKFEAKKNATNNEFTMVIDRLLSSNNDKEISMLRNALKDRKNNEEGVKFRTVLESFIKIKNAIKK